MASCHTDSLGRFFFCTLGETNSYEAALAEKNCSAGWAPSQVYTRTEWWPIKVKWLVVCCSISPSDHLPNGPAPAERLGGTIAAREGGVDRGEGWERRECVGPCTLMRSNARYGEVNIPSGKRWWEKAGPERGTSYGKHNNKRLILNENERWHSRANSLSPLSE